MKAQQNKKKKIKLVITGGHLTPAIAVIEELLKDKNKWQILFLGRKASQEGTNIPSLELKEIQDRGIEFRSIPAGKLHRHLNRWFFLSLLKVPLGFASAFSQIINFKPDVILTFGGYVAIPVAVSGWLLGIPIITHEQTTTKGLSHTMIEYLATYIAVSWKESQDYFNRPVVVTGNPIREAIIKGIQKKVTINKTKNIIYITGGNQGSHIINVTVSEALPKLLEKYNLIHQCGVGTAGEDYEFLLQKKESLEAGKKDGYLIKPWFDEQEVAWILNHASLVVSRAGANTVAEVIQTSKPSLLIPLPISGRQEQLKNAQVLYRAGSAEILAQIDLNPKSLTKSIENMIKNLSKYEANAKKMKKSIPQNAAQKLVSLIEKAYEEKKKKETPK